MRRLTLKQLETVRAVAQAGTIVQASEKLNVTPAALTSRIKLLEEDAGLALFDRCGGRLRLTAIGEEVVNAARRVDLVLTELDNTLAAIRGMRAGRIAVGVVSTAKYFAPRLIAAFARVNPGIEVTISVGNRAEMVSQLRDYGIDIGLMGRPPMDFPIESAVIGPHPQVVVAAPDHPLAKRRAIDKAELTNESFIVREEGSGTRSVFEYFFSDVVVRQPKISIEIGSNETIKQAVIAGLGIALISAHTIEAEVESGRLVILDVKGLPIVRQWFIVRRADRPFNPIGHAIWNFTVAQGPQLLPKTIQP
ncbi:LysR family transcriptional regulator [Methylovirgula sp. HY1]|uniref:LysR family transcriptional regulator n=1 Tax=Methylovirgula sp. HY1 TaxID=2822761 RepID=UPI001C5A6FAA|nr:LysR family transcriptional regulator [Methylovirgula sp. HY1]QXX75065.1 HTH-type transcriptional activator CmpR [Methylovirgula sp. HY1]